MKIPLVLRVLCGVAAGAVSLTSSLRAASNEKALSRTEVTFFEPEHFTDARDNNDTDKGRDYILGELKRHLEERAQTYIPEGAKLSVTITDVDLAGQFEPWRGPAAADVRIVKEIYPPRIKLSFRLTDANGDVTKQGDRELANMNFLMTAAPTLISDPYRHDKALIDDWLRTEFRHEKKN